MANFPEEKRSEHKAIYFSSSNIEYKNAGSVVHSYVCCHSMIMKYMITFNSEISEVLTEVPESISVFRNEILRSLLEIFHCISQVFVFSLMSHSLFRVPR